jgi:hypothetical protein
MDLVWPNGVRMSSVDWRHISNSEVFAGAYGVAQTVARPGDRLGCAVAVRSSRGAERAKLRSLAAALRGRANRIYLADLSYRKRGAFPSTELLANQDFSNGGLTGWATDASFSASVSDQVARLERNTIGAAAAALYQTLAVTQYAPHVIRALAASGRGTFASLIAGMNGINSATLTPGTGLSSCSGVPLTTSAQTWIYDGAASGNTAGDFFCIPFVSMQRCALVDNAPNQFLQSNTFANAAWTKNNVTATDNAVNGPDYLGNMARLTETAVNSTHEIGQVLTFSSGAQDIFVGCVLTALTRSWGRLRLIENTGSTVASAYFNLASGATGTIATGANWSDVRTGSVNLGGGYYYCYLIAKKTNAATSVSAFIGAATADNTGAYLGVAATNAIGVWHGVCTPSSVAVRFNATPTTSTASTGTAATGLAIYVKGLPASTSDLALRGDMVQIDNQIKFFAGDLKSDAAGFGTLVLDSPFPRALVDNAPVIFGSPMTKFYLARDVEYPTAPGDLSDFVFEFEQDLAA